MAVGDIRERCAGVLLCDWAANDCERHQCFDAACFSDHDHGVFIFLGPPKALSLLSEAAKEHRRALLDIHISRPHLTK